MLIYIIKRYTLLLIFRKLAIKLVKNERVSRITIESINTNLNPIRNIGLIPELSSLAA